MDCEVKDCPYGCNIHQLGSLFHTWNFLYPSGQTGKDYYPMSDG
jgi:hypothetical protein